MSKEKLLSRIDNIKKTHLRVDGSGETHAISDYYIGKECTGDHLLIRKLRRGTTIQLDTYDKIVSFLDNMNTVEVKSQP